MDKPESGSNSWTFLTNHSHVLLCLAKDPEMRIKTIADEVGITQRAVQGIINDLDDAGYLTRSRVGRRNRYQINPERPLRHRIEKHKSINDLILFAADFNSVSDESDVE